MSKAVISLSNVRKTFDSLVAVNDVSLVVHQGEIFGVLGPNGAGKTTLIRMIMDIIRPDAGTVEVFGHPLTDENKERIGYLPEERGLYARQRVLSVLEYFAALKGLNIRRARRNALALLERLGMSESREMRVEELSKGNQQKIQLAATLVGDPQIIVLDEPFTGLDPVNTRMVSNLIRDESAAGKTILLSTHQMAMVETLCQRVFMIDRGRRVLYGGLHDIKQQYSDRAVRVQSTADYSRCNLILRQVADNGAMKIYLREGVAERDFLTWLIETGAEVVCFERAIMPLEDIFIKVVQEGKKSSQWPVNTKPSLLTDD